MTPGGHVHFKTDNTGLYEYTFELLNSREDIVIFKNTRDFYMSEWKENHHGIMTRYEKMFMEKGETIKYIEFGFK